MAAASAAGFYVRCCPAKNLQESRGAWQASVLQTLALPRFAKAPRAALAVRMAARTRGDQKMPHATPAAANSHS